MCLSMLNTIFSRTYSTYIHFHYIISSQDKHHYVECRKRVRNGNPGKLKARIRKRKGNVANCQAQMQYAQTH